MKVVDTAKQSSSMEGKRRRVFGWSSECRGNMPKMMELVVLDRRVYLSSF
jgi:hypothetical protein